MKQFIYLDNDIVNSIIAQRDKGLIKDIKMEKSNMNGKRRKSQESLDASVGAKGGLLGFLKAESKIKAGITMQRDVDTTKTEKEIVEKTMHDENFDKAYEYIKANKIGIGNNKNDDYGQYVEMTRVFDFVDLDYLEGLFSKNGLINYMKKLTSEQIKEESSQTTKELNRKQNRAMVGQINEIIKKAINQKNKEYDDISDVINAFRKMIPYSRMLISSDGYLIPLDTKYFRVNPTSVGFMYGGDITCVGMITNIIGKDTNPNDDENIFASLQFSINEILRSILPTKEENICVIHPIAVYYNNQIIE